MPLTPTDLPAAIDAFGARFVMRGLDGPVTCHVFREAIDELEESYTRTDEEALRRVEHHRKRLEQLASQMFDGGHRTPWISAGDLLTGVGPEDYDDEPWSS